MTDQVQSKSRVIYGVLVGVIIVLVAAVGYLLGTRNASDANRDAPSDGVVAEAPQTAVPQVERVSGDRLAAATRVVLGGAGSVRRTIDDTDFTEKAVRLIETPFGPVLITELAGVETCHACTGYLGAYYLKEANGRFEVTARYPTAMQSWGWGTPPNDWQVVSTFTEYPALYAEGGYVNQGISTSGATIVELTPSGPKSSGVDLGGSNEGALESGGSNIEGKIANIARGRSFDVTFSGSCSAVQRYTLQGGEFKPSGTNACASQLEAIR